MSQIANEYSYKELFSQPARKIPWFTLVEITQKSSSHEEMLWYINETHKNGWSDRFVAEITLMNISSKLGISKYKFIEKITRILKQETRKNKQKK